MSGRIGVFDTYNDRAPRPWQCALTIAPGRHLYKFVIDGSHWIPDPANPGQEFGEAGWRDWTVLFDDYRLDWDAFDGAMHRHSQALIALRRRHPALRGGAVALIEALPEGVIGTRRGSGADAIEVLANLSDRPAQLPPTQGPVLYAQGWDQSRALLAAHGCLIRAA